MLDPIAGHLAIQQTRELARSALPDAPVRRQPEPAAARPLRRRTALEGPRAGLDLLATLDGEPLLRGSHRLDAVRAHLLEMAGDNRAARESYQAAARRTLSLPEQRHLTARAVGLAEQTEEVPARKEQVMTMPQDPKANDTAVQQRDPQPVLSVRASVPVAGLTGAQGEALRALWSSLQQHGVRPAGPPYVRYHSFGETETDVEVGIPIPVAAGAVGEGRVTAGELPGGTMVSAWHLGAHDRLGDAYAGLQAWLKEHGHQPASAGWEVYHWIDLNQKPDPAVWPDPSTWRTQLVQPIRYGPPGTA